MMPQKRGGDMKKYGMAVLFMVAVAGGLVPALLNAQEHKGPRVEIKEATHDFGKVTEGSKQQYVFELVNSGDETLVIQRIQPA